VDYVILLIVGTTASVVEEVVGRWMGVGEEESPILA
jgi:hypothetical protein